VIYMFVTITQLRPLPVLYTTVQYLLKDVFCAQIEPADTLTSAAAASKLADVYSFVSGEFNNHLATPYYSKFSCTHSA
jgi:hypothetical protein